MERKPARADGGRYGEISLPSALRGALDGWGAGMRQTANHAKQKWLREVPGGSPAVYRSSGGGVTPQSLPTLHVGTDCSGAEAPIWALRLLGIPHAHAFSSDISEAAIAMIRANCEPRVMFKDMCSRQESAVPPHNVYVCGFPCKPFSTLHHGTRLFKEPKAKPFRAMLKTVAAKTPALAIFENVPGILRAAKTLARAFRALPWYRIVLTHLDPRAFGEPVRRDRVYIIAIRRDLCVTPTAAGTRDLIVRMMAAMSGGRAAGATARLLPNDHQLVSAHLNAARRSFADAQAKQKLDQPSPRGGGAKWVKRHAAIRSELRSGGVTPLSRGMGPDRLLLTSPRERDVWRMLMARHGSAPLAADVSQSAGRVPVSLDGGLPAVTPGGQIVVTALGRKMIPLEKLLVHGFPVHRMKIPTGVSDNDLASLGGNTMHVKCIGAALLLGTGLVRWDSPASKPGCAPSGPAPKAEPLIVIQKGEVAKERASAASGGAGVRPLKSGREPGQLPPRKKQRR